MDMAELRRVILGVLGLATLILLLNCVSADYCAGQSAHHDAYDDGGYCQTIFSSLSKGDSFDIDGFTFEIIDANAVSVSKYQQDAKSDVEIPSKVTSPSGTEYVVTKIGKEAFKGRSITSVVVPDTVMNVGKEAFKDCKGLVSLSMPIDVTCDKDAFKNLKVSTITLTKGGTGIIKSEFWKPFRDSVTTLVVEEGITEFDASFKGADRLERVELKEVSSIVNEQFRGCKKLTNVVAPHLEVVGKYAFEGCQSLKFVDTPLLKTCGPGAFSKCWSLADICGVAVFVSNGMVFNVLNGDSVSMIQLIDNEVDLLSLSYVTAPSGKIYKVTQFGEEACRDMDNLRGLYLPDHFKSFGEHALKGCKNISTLKVPITLDCCYGTKRPAFQDVKPELLILTVGNAGDPIQPFWTPWKSRLKGLIVSEGITEFNYSFQDWDKLQTVFLLSVEHVIRSQFESCDNLQQVAIPSARFIDKYAFKECGELLVVKANIIDSVGYKAFQHCEKLTVFEHNMLKKIDGRAFNCCTSLKEFKFYGTEWIGEHAFFDSKVKKPDHLDNYAKIGKKAFGKSLYQKFLKWIEPLLEGGFIVALIGVGFLIAGCPIFGWVLIGIGAVGIVTAFVMSGMYIISNYGDVEDII